MSSLSQRTADLLSSQENALCARRVVAGFDGFVDTIIHVVATRTMGGAKQLYVDAVLQATGTTNGSPLNALAQIMIAGNTLDSRYFEGLVDEVAYYPTVLSLARIQAHFTAGTASQVPAFGPGARLALLVTMLALGLLALRRRAGGSRNWR